MSPTRVMVVEDSPTVRELLCEIIARDPRLEVCAAVKNGEEALRLLERVSPDIVSLDINLPGMNGLEVAERIMSEQPTPIVVIAASDTAGEQTLSLQALAAGALSVVEKPRGATAAHAYDALSARICTHLAIMSQVKVVRQRHRRSPRLPDSGLALPASGPFAALGIVCSMGGPPSLVRIFNSLGAEFPLPILLVQHITPLFLSGFASWLAGAGPFAVETVTGKRTLRPGTIYVAAPDLHLRATRAGVDAVGGEPVDGHRPSGSVLFESLAAEFGPRAIGALLTGMGEDGALGLLALKRAGGYTLTESKNTAVVYGMPAAAVGLQAERESLPLDEIASRIKELTALRGAAV